MNKSVAQKLSPVKKASLALMPILQKAELKYCILESRKERILLNRLESIKELV